MRGFLLLLGALLLPAPIRAQAPEPVEIASGDGVLHGTLYRAPDASGTVVLLHGYPGWEKNHDLAAAIQRSGRNALVFHYRGSWESTGDFSLENALADAARVLEYLGAGAAAAPVALVGHSFGSWVAMLTAAHREEVRCAAGLALTDMGRLGQLAVERAEIAAALRESSMGPVRQGQIRLRAGADTRAMLAAAADSLDLLSHVPALAQRTLLVVQPTADVELPAGQHVQPLIQALDAAGRLTLASLTTDHNFSTVRADLAEFVIRWLDEECRMKRE